MTTSSDRRRTLPGRRGGTRHGVRFVTRWARGLMAAGTLVVLVLGLPYLLGGFIGWPLPDHLPSWGELQYTLLGPMTTTFLLDVVACATWLVWAAFTLDVSRCAVEVARGTRVPSLSAAGPMRRPAAMLVGVVLIAILGNRAALALAGAPPVGAGPVGEVIATATAWSHPAGDTGGTPGVRPSGTTDHASPGRAAAVAPAYPTSAVALAPDPRTGVHDSLWRIAQRTLGDGNRWPEIFALNHGKPQPNGGTLTRPNLIFPGEEFTLPGPPSTGGAQPVAEPVPVPVTPPPATASPHPTPADTGPTPPPIGISHNPPPTTTPPDHTAGFRWGTELFLGLGLVGALNAALLTARRRHRRRYRPGSGDRGDLPMTPVVYQLRLAQLRAEHDCTAAVDAEPPPPSARPAVPNPVASPTTPALAIGVRRGRNIALDLAASRGLGLVGAGAAAAARALVITAVAEGAGHARLVVPADDLSTLLGRRADQSPLPGRLWTAPDLASALDAVEAEMLVRASLARDTPTRGRNWPSLMVVTREPDRHSPRLQAVLDNGATFGITGLVLGQWAPGITAFVRDDGTISATNPGGEQLRGTTMFRLGQDDTIDLLDLLHHAEPQPTHDGLPVDPTATPDPTAPLDPCLEILHSSGPPIGSDARPPRATTPNNHTTTTADATPPAADDRATSDTGQNRPPIEHESDGSARSPLRISVLGPPRVFWRPQPTLSSIECEITSGFQPRVRELLVFLALHPDGASRDALAAALWADGSPARTTNAMNTTLSRLRRAITTATSGVLSDVAMVDAGRFLLDPTLVEVDYWDFAQAVTDRRSATTDAQRIEANRRVVANYHGPLADGLNTEWIDTAREAIRRDAIDAVAACARALVDADPHQTLDLLEMARAFDPYNELIYRDIMRLQERLGQLDAIPRTLSLLTTRLAELDDQPTPQTVTLAEQLRHRNDP